MFSDPPPATIALDRWDEFHDRLTDLNEGVFKVHGDKKLRDWLREGLRHSIRQANQFYKANDGRFIKAVADAEKCLSLLQLLGDKSIANDPEPEESGEETCPQN